MIFAIILFIFFQVQNQAILISPSPKSPPKPTLLAPNYIVSSSTPFLFLSYSFLATLVLKKLGFSHLLNTNADVEAFKTKFNIPCDVHIAYCYEGDIKDQRLL